MKLELDVTPTHDSSRRTFTARPLTATTPLWRLNRVPRGDLAARLGAGAASAGVVARRRRLSADADPLSLVAGSVGWVLTVL